jgi:Ser/Thr protein kinase RdoA (MazF antagonist)
MSAGNGVGAETAGPIAVVHSVVAPRTVLAHVTQHFPVSSSSTCQLIKQGLNDTYLMQLPDSRLVARVYGARREPSEIAYELELLTHVATRNVRVPAPLAATDGSFAVALNAPEGDRAVSLFPYVEGAPLAWRDAAHCRLAGRLLARFHSASDDFGSAHWRCRLDADYLIDRPLRAVRPMMAHRPTDLHDLEDLASRLRADLTRLADAGLDRGVCHGDFGAKNIFAGTADADATIMDLDFCGEGFRVYDFTPIRRATLGTKTEGLWDAFLSGYCDVRPIREVDLDAVMLFRALRHLSMLGVFAENVDMWGAVDLDPWLRFLRDWDTQYSSGQVG